MTRKIDGSADAGAAPDAKFQALWREVSDELISGVHHALNNRVAALAAMVQVVEQGLGTEAPVGAALGGELNRLQETVRSLALLPWSSGVAEPILLSDCLPSLMELYTYHHAARDIPCQVECSSDLLPLRADPMRLVHLLLVLLIDTAKAASRERQAIRISCGGDAEEVAITIATTGLSDGRASAVTERDGASWNTDALQSWAEALGGQLRIRDGGPERPRVELRLPTLLALRKGQDPGRGRG